MARAELWPIPTVGLVVAALRGFDSHVSTGPSTTVCRGGCRASPSTAAPGQLNGARCGVELAHHGHRAHLLTHRRHPPACQQPVLPTVAPHLRQRPVRPGRRSPCSWEPSSTRSPCCAWSVPKTARTLPSCHDSPSRWPSRSSSPACSCWCCSWPTSTRAIRFESMLVNVYAEASSTIRRTLDVYHPDTMVPLPPHVPHDASRVESCTSGLVTRIGEKSLLAGCPGCRCDHLHRRPPWVPNHSRAARRQGMGTSARLRPRSRFRCRRES